MKARFAHDCDHCRLIAVDEHGDWYVCGTSVWRCSLICRRSSEGCDYWSMDHDILDRELDEEKPDYRKAGKEYLAREIAARTIHDDRFAWPTPTGPRVGDGRDDNGERPYVDKVDFAHDAAKALCFFLREIRPIRADYPDGPQGEVKYNAALDACEKMRSWASRIRHNLKDLQWDIL